MASPYTFQKQWDFTDVILDVPWSDASMGTNRLLNQEKVRNNFRMNRMMVIVCVLEDELNITFKVTDRFTHLKSRIMPAGGKLKQTWQAIKLQRIRLKLPSYTGPYRSEDDFFRKGKSHKLEDSFSHIVSYKGYKMNLESKHLCLKHLWNHLRYSRADMCDIGIFTLGNKSEVSIHQRETTEMQIPSVLSFLWGGGGGGGASSWEGVNKANN